MSRSARELPIYLSIVDNLRSRIAGGEFRPGDRLPSEAELSTAFRTTRATVARGLRELVYEGVVTREAGRGSFVAHPPVSVPFEPMRIQSFEEQVGVREGGVEYRLLDHRLEPAPNEVSAVLGVQPGMEIHRIERLRVVGGLPLSLVTRYVGKELGDGFSAEDLGRHSIHRLLARAGRPVAHTDGWISVASAATREASLMEVKAGAPVLVRTYVLRGSNREPLAFGRSLYREEFHITYGISARMPS